MDKFNDSFLKYFKKLLAPLAIAISLFLVLSSPVLAAQLPPRWSYGGADNPTRWGSISQDFALCELGKNQSPINIKNAIASLFT
jgi:carbonic anhydrase